MAHIHDLIDFTVAMFVVYKGRVLFIHHKKQGMWLPIGGHIELNEDPEEALFRELYEETGLGKNDVEILTTKPNFESPVQKYLYTPNLMDIHQINESHRHIGIMYFLRSLKKQVKLEKDAHNAIKWFSQKDLRDEKYNIREDIIYAAVKAIELEKTFTKNKRLKFVKELIPLVLSGKKTSTWRLWDDKNLSVDDIVDFVEQTTEHKFAVGKIIKVTEKPFKELKKDDKEGHESFKSNEEIYKTYSKYYNKKVDKNTVVKIIWFKLI